MLIDSYTNDNLTAHISRIGGLWQITHQTSTTQTLIELVVTYGIQTTSIATGQILVALASLGITQILGLIPTALVAVEYGTPIDRLGLFVGTRHLL